MRSKKRKGGKNLYEIVSRRNLTSGGENTATKKRLSSQPFFIKEKFSQCTDAGGGDWNWSARRKDGEGSKRCGACPEKGGKRPDEGSREEKRAVEPN